MNRISLENVGFSYGRDRQVLRGLTLDVPAGHIVGLLGANGAGKTTTFRIAAGLLRPDNGTVTIDGIAAAAQPIEARQRTAFVPDTSLLYDHMSAEENLNMFALLWNVDAATAEKRGAQLLRDAGLWNVRDEWVRGYSAGMKQKLSFCAALLHDPQVIILDEPFSGFDVDGALWGREVIRIQARAGKSILFSSHVPELVEAIADTVAILDRGVIVNTAAIADVKHAGGAVRHFTSHVSKAS
jgi:ABC-2 type transport system ATP-binding protein